MKRWLVASITLLSISAVASTALILTRPPRNLASAEQAWQHAGIENYTLDITVDGCMTCTDPPLRYWVVVTNGVKTSEHDPFSEKPGQAPTVEDLFREIEGYGPDAEVTYNNIGVPTEMELDRPDVADDEVQYTVTFTET